MFNLKFSVKYRNIIVIVAHEATEWRCRTIQEISFKYVQGYTRDIFMSSSNSLIYQTHDLVDQCLVSSLRFASCVEGSRYDATVRSSPQHLMHQQCWLSRQNKKLSLSAGEVISVDALWHRHTALQTPRRHDNDDVIIIDRAIKGGWRSRWCNAVPMTIIIATWTNRPVYRVCAMVTKIMKGWVIAIGLISTTVYFESQRAMIVTTVLATVAWVAYLLYGNITNKADFFSMTL